MGVVYLARDTKLGREVALKFLPPQWSHDEGAKQRFLREAQAASATNHRNICIIHDIEQTDDGQLFIVMAYYEGQTLKQKLENGALPLGDALEIAGEVAEGLAKAHAQGVVHRDIKPGNLIVTDDGVKILDFGLAKFADALQLTMLGSTLGTVAYMSPEQARGEEADERSDLWALGVVLYEMLTGEVPFKGTYAEAIFYAIKNEEPAPLSRESREIPADVETLVRRALTKDPAGRFQHARELARELRQLQGRSVPLELQTEPLPFVQGRELRAGKRRSRVRWWATAASALATAAAVYFWLARPIERIPIAVVPIANHTGEPELDGYRLALTAALVTELGDSPNLRVISYPRTLELLRRFVGGGGDVSSLEAIQTLSSQSGANLLVVPSLEYTNGAWRAHAELRNAATRTSVAAVDTEAITSSLPKETMQRLINSLASKIQNQFAVRWPHRITARSAEGRFRDLEAARAFEEGINAYDQMEYASAAAAFRRAVQSDPQRSIGHVWLSRATLVMGDSRGAEAAGQTAVRLLGPNTPRADALFAAAVLAESQNDSQSSEQRYREIAALQPDASEGQLELAGFLKRQGKNEQAVDAYHEALRREPGLIRAHVDLCQLYSAVDDYPLSEQHAQTALKNFRAVQNRGGEAQSLLCYGDALVQQGIRLKEARQYIEGARDIFTSLNHPYGLSRVFQYLGYLAGRERNYPAAAQAFQEALSRSRQIGNRQIEGLVLMNLGVAHESMGDPARAVGFYQQSRDVYQEIGDERRAAEQEVNAGSLWVDYGNDPTQVRRLENARATFQKLGYVDFEVFAMQVLAESHMAAGRLNEALRLLREATSVATERQLKKHLALLKVRTGSVGVLQSDYETARRVLEEVVASGDATPEATIALGRAYVRLGDFTEATRYLESALADVQRSGETKLLHLVGESLGELAYEAGDLNEARTRFQNTAAASRQSLPDPASIEASCHLASLGGAAMTPTQSEQMLKAGIAQARKMGQMIVHGKCAVDLARVQVERRRYGDALETLRGIRPDPQTNLGLELEAQGQYWRGRALAALSNSQAGDAERSAALTAVTKLRDSLPEKYRLGFAARTSIRPLFN